MRAEILVVGAGASGLACARRITEAGGSCVVLDRGRRPGGRASSRRLEDGRFVDLGVPFFRLSDPESEAFMAPWHTSGALQPWPGRVVDFRGDEATPRDPARDRRWTGAPTMGALLAAMAEGLHVVQERTVVVARHKGRDWAIQLEGGGEVTCKALVLAMPLTQARRLVADPPGPAGATDACMMLAVDFAAPSGLVEPDVSTPEEAEAWLFHGDPLLAALIRRPGRPSVVHASDAWSRPRLSTPTEHWTRDLATEVGRRFGTEVRAVHAHRWSFARPREPLEGLMGWDDERHLGICGDAWVGPDGRFEGAVLSGLAAARRALRALQG
ncbi:MAG: FAD-dependent oxidoreductase [Candidatus Sericytochromatia bacterium]|nr:FAD-dependent oxidoreductase [Candidatus Sericytochromatia bacterium]